MGNFDLTSKSWIFPRLQFKTSCCFCFTKLSFVTLFALLPTSTLILYSVTFFTFYTKKTKKGPNFSSEQFSVTPIQRKSYITTSRANHCPVSHTTPFNANNCENTDLLVHSYNMNEFVFYMIFCREPNLCSIFAYHLMTWFLREI